uniref:Fc receptor, IgE, high affinity I, gamma polypeptide like n=1 Tax=Mola mola TaxID=94237 RepID=A0A3Q3XPZ7_MOLML
MYIHGTTKLLLLQLLKKALGDMSLCYILDGILIVYGIVLTILYSRLRVRHTNTHTTMFKVTVVSKGGGLASQSSDTYETIKMDKKPYVC